MFKKNIMTGLAVGLVCILGYFLYTSIKKTPYRFKTPTQVILVAIDETEPSKYDLNNTGRLSKKAEIGASGIDLLTALYQEECIIIVTASIASYIMRYLSEVSLNPLSLEPAIKIEPQNWIKKKVTDYLYILIPKKYLEERINNDILPHENYTQEELSIGIAFATKEDISDADFMSPTYHKKNTEYPKKTALDFIGEYKTELKGSWISEHVVKHLGDIFIPFHLYATTKHVPTSAFLLFGHGTKYTSLEDRLNYLTSLQKDPKIFPEFKEAVDAEIEDIQVLKKSGEKAHTAGKIAGLMGKDFGTFVCYLQKNLSVTLLFTSTCFGAEINLEKALQDSIHDESACKDFENLSFPLISGAISSAVAMGGYQLSIFTNDNNERKIILKQPNYKKFFEALTIKNNDTNKLFFDAIHYIYPLYKKYETYNNIPSIKYPGQPWHPLDMPKIFFTLDKTITNKTHDFDISPYFVPKKVPTINESFEPPPIDEFLAYKLPYPNVLFIEQAEIPFELIISGSSKIDLPAFISHIPGDAVHHFAKIDASTYELSRFLEAFFTIYDLHDNKTFIIDELLIKNDLTILPYDLGKSMTLHNVILQNKAISYSTNPPKKSVFFKTPDGKEWSAEDITMNNPVGFAIREAKKQST